MSPVMTGMPLHIDLKQYLNLPSVVKAEFDGWLRAESLMDKGVIELTLTEGAVTVVHHEYDDAGKIICEHTVAGLAPKLVTTTFPIKTQPPEEAFK